MCSEGLRERYVNPYTDFAFKLLFGTDLNKEILIGFLNALFDGKQVIEDVIEQGIQEANKNLFVQVGSKQ